MWKKKTAAGVFAALIALLCAFLIAGAVSDITGGSVYAEEADRVYLGGTPVGIIQNADGAVITKLVEVETKDGKVSPVGSAGGKTGDIILTIDGKRVVGSDDIRQAILGGGDSLLLKLKRGDREFEIAVRPAFDLVLKEKKLGVLIKDSVAGVGTLTFVRPDLTFGALGHRIYDNVASDKEIYKTGNVFPCNIIGYVKGVPGEAGELRGTFNRSGQPSGRIEKNLFCGVFGKFESGGQIVGRELTAVGHRNEVSPGKAKIFTTLNGKTPAYYDVEIVKTVVQNVPKEKSMVIRVTDSTLLKETGGIVQGMSGSPILQNGKLVGAVTHVFVNDPTSGYGIYLDWMLQN